MKDAVKAMSGSLGGKARIVLHGNPGTKEGRKLGGLRSLETHKKNKSGFKLLKKVKLPQHSEELAELMGILAGDGHLGTYQVSITTNADTDIEHAQYVRDLFVKLFDSHVSIKRKLTCNAVVVLLSSKTVCDFLESQGMIRGNKVVAQISPPPWVVKREEYRKSYLRGLIDTDGTAYYDKHCVKGKSYSSICIAFTNASVPLLDFVQQTLEEYGYHPTRFGRDIRLRRRKEVLDYVKTVGFNNSKHARRIGV